MDNNNFTLNDLILAVNIIDACTERGAFKGNELLTVGQLRDKFAKIVAENQPPKEKTEKTED